MSYFFSFYGVFLAKIIIFYLVGYLLLRFLSLKKNIDISFWEIAQSLLVGVVASITIASIIATKFVTINILFLFIGFFLYLSAKKNILESTPPSQIPQKTDFKLLKSNLLMLFVAHILLFCFCFFNSYLFNNQNAILPFKVPNSDILHYARISEYLFSNGQENPSRIYNDLSASFNGATPYHYFELWLNGLICIVFNILSLPCWLFITTPILTFLCLITYLSVQEHFLGKVSILGFVLALVLLGMGGFAFNWFKSVQIFTEFMSFSLNIFVEIGKFMPILLFMATAVLLLLKNKKEQAILVLLATSVASFIAFPAIIGGTFFTILVFYANGTFTKKTFLKSLFYLISIVIFTFIFYYLAKPNLKTNASANVISYFLENFLNIELLITRVLIIFRSILVLLIINILIIICLFFFHKKLRIIIFPLFSIAFCGIISWVMLNENTDAPQLAYFVVIVSFHILGYLSGLLLYGNILNKTFNKELNVAFNNQSNKYKNITHYASIMILGVFLLMSAKKLWHIKDSFFYKSFISENSYLEKVKKIVQNTDNQVNNSPTNNQLGVYMISKKIAKKFYPFINNNSLGIYTGFFANKLIFIPIFNDDSFTSFSVEQKITIEENFHSNNVFSQYLSQTMHKNVAQAQEEFIKKHQIKLILLVGDVYLNENLKKYIKETIKDSTNNETLLRLDY